MPVWAYLLAAYLGWSLLKIRTYLEHRAHEAARARTVIIESRGPLSASVPEQQFPCRAPYASGRGVVPASGAVFRQPRPLPAAERRLSLPQLHADHPKFLFRAKDPVPHPIFPVDKGGATRSDDPAETRGAAGVVEERNPGLVMAGE
jgi:hypothetical protein